MVEGLPIYKIKVEDKERKAIDIEGLSDWIDQMIISSNPLVTDFKDIPGDTSLDNLKGMVGWGMLNELNANLKNALGLIPKQEEKQTEQKPEQPEDKNSVEKETSDNLPPKKDKPEVIENDATEEVIRMED